MKRNVIKLKESDLTKLIKRIISEQTSACEVHQGAMATQNSTNPQLGDAGITQNFVNNMAGKSSQFHNSRAVAFMDKITELNNGMSPLFCTGQNPYWQAKLFNKKVYAENCIANPGSC